MRRVHTCNISNSNRPQQSSSPTDQRHNSKVQIKNKYIHIGQNSEVARAAVPPWRLCGCTPAPAAPLAVGRCAPYAACLGTAARRGAACSLPVPAQCWGRPAGRVRDQRGIQIQGRDCRRGGNTVTVRELEVKGGWGWRVARWSGRGLASGGWGILMVRVRN